MTKNIFCWILALALSAHASFAADTVFQTDKLKVGKANSSADKEMILDINQGANNPKIKSVVADQDIQVQANTVRVGKPAAGNKQLDFNIGAGASNPKLRYNNSTGKIEFSNNGTDYKSIGSGSGSGGGINPLGELNADFEAGTANWSASGGSFTVATSGGDLLFDTRSGVFNSSAGSQFLNSTGFVVPNGLASANGFASCFFKTSANDYKIQVYDGSNVLAERLIPVLSIAQEIGISFVYPASGSVQLRIASQSDAADLALDNCYLGSSRVFDTTRFIKIGSLTHPNTTSCLWQTTSTTFANFAADADCGTPTVTGSLVAPGTKIPGFVIPSAPPGEYVIYANGIFYPNTAGAGYSCHYRVSDGTNADGLAVAVDNATTPGARSPSNNILGHLTLTAPVTNYTVQIQGMTTSGANACNIENSPNLSFTTPNARTKFDVYYRPLVTEQTMRFDTVAWSVDANIAGANIDLGSTDQATYVGMTNAGLTLVQNSGSLATQIACAGATESSGVTCTAADESNGISFVLPIAGEVDACVSFGHQAQTAGGGSIAAAFQIVETPNNAQTISQEGKDRVPSAVGTANTNVTHPVKVCGTFTFASAGKKTLRLFYEQDNSVTITNNLVLADGLVSQGQRDIHWTVSPKKQNVPAPLLVGGVASNSTGIERTERAVVTCSGSSSIGSQSGAWVSSIGNISGGACVLTLASGIFSAAPTCGVSANGTTGTPVITSVSSSGATSVTIDCANDAGTACASYGANIRCQGPR